MGNIIISGSEGRYEVKEGMKVKYLERHSDSFVLLSF